MNPRNIDNRNFKNVVVKNARIVYNARYDVTDGFEKGIF